MMSYDPKNDAMEQQSDKKKPKKMTQQKETRRDNAHSATQKIKHNTTKRNQKK